jgi:hypothetical protein
MPLDPNALLREAARDRGSSPWSLEYAAFAVVANLVGAILVIAGWFGASNAVSLNHQVAWLELGVVGLIVAGTADVFWLLRGRRAIAAATGNLLSTTSLESVFPLVVPTHAPAEDGARRVFVEGTSHHHRPTCLMVAGKAVKELPRGGRRGLTACEVCDEVPVP